jgi:hypothetical protein
MISSQQPTDANEVVNSITKHTRQVAMINFFAMLLDFPRIHCKEPEPSRQIGVARP